MGTSSLLISDSKAKVLIDGFVTRPSIEALFFGTEPDTKLIEKLIDRYDLRGKLKVIIPVHSHHDHAMDAPIFAEKTGADLIGTPSTLNIAHTEIATGINFKEALLNKSYKYENFKITLLNTNHGSIPTALLRKVLGMGKQIVEPITYPARLWDYKESQPFSILIERGSESMLVHASTGVKQGSLNLAKADWVFLGISKLNELDIDEQNIYFDETVAAVEASRIVPIHWDDIFRSKQERLYPAKKLIGDFSQELVALESQVANYQRTSAIRLMKKGETIFLDNRTNQLLPSTIDLNSDGCLLTVKNVSY
ncbi:MAG: MBL fold metallo-hydrolase [Paraglaciecola sp.]|uniref:MBL fold metallo-hydrolase n=1 Tax=Paraglaciecola sp. TaxID=1920173 RepID=UPI00329739D7